MDVDPAIIEFATKVISSEVRTLRVRGVIRRDDEEDIASTLMLQLLEAWGGFNSARAPAAAFVHQIVSTRLISILRKRSAQKRRGRTVSIDASDERLVDRTSATADWQRQIDIKCDLKDALKQLTPKQREICDILLREAVTPAAREMGVPRSTLRDAIAKINTTFSDAGLDQYLGTPPHRDDAA